MGGRGKGGRGPSDEAIREAGPHQDTPLPPSLPCASDKVPCLYFFIFFINLCQDGEASESRTGRQMTLVGNHAHTRARPSTVVLHTDLIGKQFWEEHPDLLGPKK